MIFGCPIVREVAGVAGHGAFGMPLIAIRPSLTQLVKHAQRTSELIPYSESSCRETVSCRPDQDARDHVKSSVAGNYICM
jgi:hypothetical protein